MSETQTLAAEPKERAGKGAARAARRDGRVPGVIYGAKKSPVMITLDPKDLAREIRGGGSSPPCSTSRSAARPSGSWPATCSCTR